jgi:predicted DNA-binding antitoxin AbrB/MazE fold protein
MNFEVEAVYENGVLKPEQELPLPEGQKVTVSVKPAGSAARRFCGSLCWPGNPEELDRYLNDADESSWGSRDI